MSHKSLYEHVGINGSTKLKSEKLRKLKSLKHLDFERNGGIEY
jgi:hypothetical protein